MVATRRSRVQGDPSQVDARDREDGSRSISFYFYAKGRGKAQITVQQEKLASQDAALKQKKVWAKSLRDLAELAAAD